MLMSFIFSFSYSPRSKQRGENWVIIGVRIGVGLKIGVRVGLSVRMRLRDGFAAY